MHLRKSLHQTVCAKCLKRPTHVECQYKQVSHKTNMSDNLTHKGLKMKAPDDGTNLASNGSDKRWS